MPENPKYPISDWQLEVANGDTVLGYEQWVYQQQEWSYLDSVEITLQEAGNDSLQHYVVLYRDEKIMAPFDPPFGFRCQAESTEHAEEQCLNAEGEVDMVWVYEGSDYQAALDDYYRNGLKDPASCDHEYEFSRYCGADVCVVCGDHKGLARCFCGWSASGGDGRAELEDMGEQIDEDY